jgi:hypothetical protein
MEITVGGADSLNSLASQIAQFKNQTDFATSCGLNLIAGSVQASETQEAQRAFVTRPNGWFSPGRPTGLNRTFSNKTNLEASVYSTFHAIPLQEQGGTRTPSGKTLAIPDKSGLGVAENADIPKNERPRAIRNDSTVFSGTIHGIAGIWQRVGKNSVMLLYKYEKSASIKQRYNFLPVAETTINDTWTKSMETAIDKSLETCFK